MLGDAWELKSDSLKALGQDEAALMSCEKAREYIGDYHHNASLENLRRQIVPTQLAKLEQSLTENPDNWELWHQQGNLLVKLYRYTESLEAYDHALSYQPEIAKIWCDRAIAFYHLNKMDLVIQSCDRAIACNPNEFMAWHLRGVALSFLEQYETAVTSFDRAIECNPNPVRCFRFENMNPWLMRGDAYRYLERHEAAINSYDQAIEIAKAGQFSDRELLYNRSMALIHLGEFEAAFLCFYDNQSIESSEIWMERFSNPDFWCHFGEIFICSGMGDYQESVICLSKALEINPNHLDSLKHRAYAFLSLKSYEAAGIDYEKLLALQPDKSDFWCNYGIALSHLNRHQESLASYNKAIEIKPTDVSLWNNRGNVLRKLNQYEEAISSYDQALSLNKHNRSTEAVYGKAITYALQENVEKTLENLRILKLDANCHNWVKTEPAFDFIRHIDEFKLLFDKYPQEYAGYW